MEGKSESLTEEVTRLMREPIADAPIGMTGWAQGVEGVEAMADRLSADEWNGLVIKHILRTLEGLHNAVIRLAEEIEKQNASR